MLRFVTAFDMTWSLFETTLTAQSSRVQSYYACIVTMKLYSLYIAFVI